MKKYWICLAAGVLFLSAGGCIFGGSSSGTRFFDLTAPEKGAAVLPYQVNFTLFRNLSGSDRRFLERHPGGRMVSDEFNRWMLDPELMLERYFRARLSGKGRRSVHVRGVITSFEINTEKKQAEMAVDFTLRCGGRSCQVLCRAQKALEGTGGDAAAAAMSRCAAETAKELKAAVEEFMKDK